MVPPDETRMLVEEALRFEIPAEERDAAARWYCYPDGAARLHPAEDGRSCLVEAGQVAGKFHLKAFGVDQRCIKMWAIHVEEG